MDLSLACRVLTIKDSPKRKHVFKLLLSLYGLDTTMFQWNLDKGKECMCVQVCVLSVFLPIEYTLVSVYILCYATEVHFVLASFCLPYRGVATFIHIERFMHADRGLWELAEK